MQMQSQAALKAQIAESPVSPGVYQMLDANKQIIYIGKAKNLKKRLTSYLKPDLTTRISRMVFLARHIEYTITESEAGALLLEAQLIKKFQPKFNILLKDDKSFPYIKLRLDHDFPQVIKYRSKLKEKGKIFGPFASGLVVNNTLDEIHKTFKLRNCSDHYFATRKRPCLQYQIKRCYAPCVGKISKEEYKELVTQTEQFLSGKTLVLQTQLAKRMEDLSQVQEYEKAAQIRDRIKALTYIQAKSGITGAQGISDCDVIVIASSNDIYCVQVFLYRAGQSFGSQAYFPVHTAGSEIHEVLDAFLGQFYQTRVPPKEILLNCKLRNSEILVEAIKKLHNVKTSIMTPERGNKLKLMQLAKENAQSHLEQHVKNSVKNHLIFGKLQELFEISAQVERIEIYDNSHIMGSFAVGAMVVAGADGFEKREYRIFNVPIVVSSLEKGDDYAMLRAVLLRRFERLKKEPAKMPSLMIIDGGKGHMGVVEKVMQEMGFDIPFVCMSKGPDRHAGIEQFHTVKQSVFTLDKSDPVMKYLQILRDEAHNFAITRHRRNRSNAITVSSLDKISGIGKVRKKALLNYFGDFKAIASASLDELAAAPNISKSIAKTIHDALH
jgi:excinuclease ABC subunit C